MRYSGSQAASGGETARVLTGTGWLTELESCGARGILNVFEVTFLCDILTRLASLNMTDQKELARTKNGTTTKKRITRNQLFSRITMMYTRKENVLTILRK